MFGVQAPQDHGEEQAPDQDPVPAAAIGYTDGSTIKIGYLGPQSGALASTFAPQLSGVQTFVKYWNDKGGVNGHKLDLTALHSTTED